MSIFPLPGFALSLTRLATHPFLSRYRLTLRIEGPRGCTGTAELFPDTGYAGRRNVYQQASGVITVLGQYDARVFDPGNCTIRLVEFQSLVGQATFLGAFDVDAQKRWRFISSSVRGRSGRLKSISRHRRSRACELTAGWSARL